MELIITRHGETEENLRGIIQGHLPGKLSEEGIRQAKKLGKRFKDEKIDFIFSSDLDRAKNTAKEIIKFHPKTPFKLKRDLREVNWGELQGKKSLEIKDPIKRVKGIEKIEETHKRAKKIVEYLLKNCNGKRVLIVTHGAFQSVLINHLIGEEITKKQKTENTAVTIFSFSEIKKPKLALFNCTKHLR